MSGRCQYGSMSKNGDGGPEMKGIVEVCGEYGSDSCSVNGRVMAGLVFSVPV